MQPVLVDSNILIDIFSDDGNWAQWSIDQLTLLSQSTILHINPIIYSDISMVFGRIEDLHKNLAILPLRYTEIPQEALFLAGKAFLKYRRSKGTKSTTLPDFFIGAHGAVKNWGIITRDAKRMAYYYPSLTIFSPGQEFQG